MFVPRADLFTGGFNYDHKFSFDTKAAGTVRRRDDCDYREEKGGANGTGGFGPPAGFERDANANARMRRAIGRGLNRGGVSRQRVSTAVCDGFAVRVGCANDDVVKFLRRLTRADSF